MISEPQQEQAALHALGLLDADEAAAFEREMRADAGLRGFARELDETIALLAWAGDRSMQTPPPALKTRVLAQVKAPGARTTWLPWALAALLLGCSGVLLWDVQNREARLTHVERQLAQAKPELPDDPLAQVSFCALEPTPDFATAQPRAMVLWDSAHRQGKLRVNRLAPPAAGKDYQLWTVENGRKDAVSAGVFHVDADGKAEVPFQPSDADGKPVAAVAISLEQAGGSPTTHGPILLVGKF